MESGNLSLTVLSAKHVATKDVDSFCSVCLLDGEKLVPMKNSKNQTKIIKKSHDPEWNETFEFFIKPGVTGVRINIRSKGTFKSTLLGNCFLSIADIRLSEHNEQWFSLYKDGKKEPGEVHIRYDYTKQAQTTEQPLTPREEKSAKEFEKVFNAPPEEKVIEKHICTNHGKLLHSGTMYITRHYLFFASSSKKIKLKLLHVTAIEKKTLVMIPAIRIVLENTKEYIFSGINGRDKLATLLSDLRSKAISESQAGETNSLGSEDSDYDESFMMLSDNTEGSRFRSGSLTGATPPSSKTTPIRNINHRATISFGTPTTPMSASYNGLDSSPLRLALKSESDPSLKSSQLSTPPSPIAPNTPLQSTPLSSEKIRTEGVPLEIPASPVSSADTREESNEPVISPRTVAQSIIRANSTPSFATNQPDVMESPKIAPTKRTTLKSYIASKSKTDLHAADKPMEKHVDKPLDETDKVRVATKTDEPLGASESFNLRRSLDVQTIQSPKVRKPSEEKLDQNKSDVLIEENENLSMSRSYSETAANPAEADQSNPLNSRRPDKVYKVTSGAQSQLDGSQPLSSEEVEHQASELRKRHLAEQQNAQPAQETEGVVGTSKTQTTIQEKPVSPPDTPTSTPKPAEPQPPSSPLISTREDKLLERSPVKLRTYNALDFVPQAKAVGGFAMLFFVLSLVVPGVQVDSYLAVFIWTFLFTLFVHLASPPSVAKSVLNRTRTTGFDKKTKYANHGSSAASSSDYVVELALAVALTGVIVLLPTWMLSSFSMNFAAWLIYSTVATLVIQKLFP